MGHMGGNKLKRSAAGRVGGQGKSELAESMMKRQLLIILALAMLISSLGSLGGCARQRQEFSVWTTRMRLQDQLERADEAFSKGEYLFAATLYESISDRYPLNTPQRAEFRLRQGLALYKLNTYHDARRVFLDLIQEFPESTEAVDARAYIQRVDYYMSPYTGQRAEAFGEVQDDLARLEALKVQYPHDDRIHRTIGELYWELGNYDEAMRHYTRAMELDAANREILYNRGHLKVVDEQGTLAVMTPEEQLDREREEQPLQVFNLYTYKQRGRGDLGSSFYDKYTLTGMVRNQSRQIQRNVRLNVTFYNAQFYVLGSAERMIGTMAPGEVRSFVISTDTADNLYNIEHYRYSITSEGM